MQDAEKLSTVEIGLSPSRIPTHEANSSEAEMQMEIQAAIKALTERQSLTSEQMQSVMQTIMTGEATQAQIGGFLIALRMKGETVDEVAGAAQVMRELAAGVQVER